MKHLKTLCLAVWLIWGCDKEDPLSTDLSNVFDLALNATSYRANGLDEAVLSIQLDQEFTGYLTEVTVKVDSNAGRFLNSTGDQEAELLLGDDGSAGITLRVSETPGIYSIGVSGTLFGQQVTGYVDIELTALVATEVLEVSLSDADLTADNNDRTTAIIQVEGIQNASRTLKCRLAGGNVRFIDGSVEKTILTDAGGAGSIVVLAGTQAEDAVLTVELNSRVIVEKEISVVRAYPDEIGLVPEKYSLHNEYGDTLTIQLYYTRFIGEVSTATPIEISSYALNRPDVEVGMIVPLYVTSSTMSPVTLTYYHTPLMEEEILVIKASSGTEGSEVTDSILITLE